MRPSPYMTQNEAASYCRAGIDRLHGWVERGLLIARHDPDGRRHYHLDDLDAVMHYKPEAVPERESDGDDADRDEPVRPPRRSPMVRPKPKGLPEPAPPAAASSSSARGAGLPFTPAGRRGGGR